MAPVASSVADFRWMTDLDRGVAMACVESFVRQAFTVLRPPEELSWEAIREACPSLMPWLESMPDEKVVAICWDLLNFEPGFTPQPVWWLHHSGRLSGAISDENLRLAVSLEQEGDAMLRWPEARCAVMSWERDSHPFIELLSHSSYLVRAAAARNLGCMYFNLKTKASGGGIPDLPEILGMIQAYEVKTAGIAGPFLDGAQWPYEGEVWSPPHCDVDMKAWFMETLSNSDRERDVPHIQSLEFYAHELFSGDADSIREFLRMGRTELAAMTAAEAPDAVPPDLLQSLWLRDSS
jgi:hypothetical protein